MKSVPVIIGILMMLFLRPGIANADPWGSMTWGLGLWSVDASAEESVTLSLTKGWNLKGSPVPLPAALFAGYNIQSVWKWIGGGWAVSMPDETPSGQYAQSKGFKELVIIYPGEGFWVNSKQSTTISVNGPTDYGELSTNVTGWNLLGVKSAAGMSIAKIATICPEAESVWKWSGGNWAVSLPQQADVGAGFAASKQFGFLSTLEPGDGFWVNCKAGQ